MRIAACSLTVQAYQAQVLNKEIATSMQTAIPPALRSLFQSKQIITELVPFLMRIISPPLKPVGTIKSIVGGQAADGSGQCKHCQDVGEGHVGQTGGTDDSPRPQILAGEGGERPAHDAARTVCAIFRLDRGGP